MLLSLLPLGFSFGVLATAAVANAGSYPKSDHYDGERFFNPQREDQKSFWDLLKWQWTKDRKEWPEKVENRAVPELPSSVTSGEGYFTFVNHASYLVQLKSINLLTDPQYSERASPVQWAGPKRVRAPGVDFEKLPRLDVVVVSHNHYDHMDLPTLKRLKDKFDPVFLVPLGNARILEGGGIPGAIELDWWQSREVKGIKITLVPVHHWSSRTPWDRNRALWGGFFIEGDGIKTLFAGDTGYGPNFKEIAEKMGSPDVSLLPIGAYEPRWFMKPQHMNPAEAVQAHLDLASRLSLGIHFGTFQLTDEGIDEPVTALAAARIAAGIAPESFIAPEVGSTIRVTGAR